jgi:DNA-binding MarR family transcriptional regulator
MKSLDVKSYWVKNMAMKKGEEQDHVDAWLEDAWLEDMPFLDLEVEAIVDRMNGLSRRIKRRQEAVIAEHGLTYEEWDVLGALRQTGPPFRRSAGSLAKRTELSSGAMTNRLDRLEKAGLVRRTPDPNDRRGVLIELTDAGEKKWVDTAKVQAAYENLIGAALNKSEQQRLNALLRRIMVEFERREDGDSKKP